MAILEDPDAKPINPNLPAFLSPPEGAPVYHGFPLIPESDTDGWLLGAITAFEDPEGSAAGDAFVVAPDGARAGLAWMVGTFPLTQILPPEPRRWGVYSVAFPAPIRSRDDLIAGFRSILPELKAIYHRIHDSAP